MMPFDEEEDAPTPSEMSEERDADLEDTVAAIREAIQEMDSGSRGIPLEEFIEKFEAKHGLSRHCRADDRAAIEASGGSYAPGSTSFDR